MNTRSASVRLHRSIELAAWALAAAGYFGPWIAHPTAALAWNAFDLFDILRILPEIETLALAVNLYALRLPAVGLALLLPLLLAEARPVWRWGAALVGAALLVNTLPPYAVIRTAWRAPGWRVPFWWGVGGLLALAGLTGFGPRLRDARWRAWLALAWLLLTGIPAFLTFPRLLPALETLYAAPVIPGWGFWAYGAGLLTLAISLWTRGVQSAPVQKEKEKAMNVKFDKAPLEPADAYTVELRHVRTVKERYEQELLTKANVVGVGIGLRSHLTMTTSETLSVIVNVTHKVPLKTLAPEDRIPAELEGVPVKVEAIGQPTAQPAGKQWP